MKLDKKTELAIRTLGVGKARIVFVNSRLKDIKEAITKQDIRDLVVDGAILVKETKGRKFKLKRKTKKGPAKTKKNVDQRKEKYMILTRKLRRYVKDAKLKGKLDREQSLDLRKKIRNKSFKSLAHLKEYIGGFRK